MATAERIDPRAQHEVRALLTRVGDTLSPDELERLCQRIYIRGELWRPLLNLGKDRVCEALYLDSCVGVYLISWSPGDETQLHDHEGRSGAAVVAQGTIREERPGPEGSDGPARPEGRRRAFTSRAPSPPHRERQRPACGDDPLLLAAARDHRDVPRGSEHARRPWPSSSRPPGLFCPAPC